MTTTPVLTVDRAGDVVTVRLDRPGALNALNGQVLAELDVFLGKVAHDGTRVVVLTGTGDRAFCAGADLEEITGLGATEAYELLATGQHVLSRLARSPVPVVAAVNGLALGGGFELALSCTFAVLAEGAELGLPETGLGLIPGYGGTQRLARRIGLPAAAHAILTGERFTAQRAYALGLTPVPPVPAEALLARTQALAHQIATRGPRAVRAALLALHQGADGDLGPGLALESALAGLATGSEEAAEGVSAFRERRSPDFTDPPVATEEGAR